MPGLSALDCTPAAGATLAPGADDDLHRHLHGAPTPTSTAARSTTPRPCTATASTATRPRTPARPSCPTATDADVSLVKKLDSLSGDTATWLITVANSGTGALPGPFTVTDQLPERPDLRVGRR